MNGIFLIIGGNMGDRIRYMNEAKELIRERIGAITRQSKLYETAAWGNETQSPYLNQVLMVNTALEPMALMQTCLMIEQELGRIRKEKWESRPIDIDILFYHNQQFNSDHLIIPHPRIQDRRFVLLPFCEIAAHEIHPILQVSMEQLLETCPDHLPVLPYEGL